MSSVNHNDLANIGASDHHSKTTSAEILLADMGEKNHASLDNVLPSQHHTKTTSSEISLADLLEKNHGSLNGVTPSQHHAKTVSSEILLAQMGEKNHASLDNVLPDQHHPQSHTIASHSDLDLTGDQILDGLMHGSDQHDYFPCSLVSGNCVVGSGVWFYRPASVGTVDIVFMGTAPTSRTTQSLYVDGWKIGLWDADASDYIARVRVHGQTWDAQTLLDEDTTSYTTPQAATHNFTAVNAGSYDVVLIEIRLSVTTITDIELAYVLLRGYYSG